MIHFVYILYSSTRDRYYIGSCSNIDVRLKRHNDGATISTKTGRPWIVKYSEQFDSKTEALKRENYLKRMKSRGLIENLIANVRKIRWKLSCPPEFTTKSDRLISPDPFGND